MKDTRFESIFKNKIKCKTSFLKFQTMGRKRSYASILVKLSCHRILNSCHIWVVKFQTSKLHQASPCNMESFRCNDNKRTERNNTPNFKRNKPKWKTKKSKTQAGRIQTFCKNEFSFFKIPEKVISRIEVGLKIWGVNKNVYIIWDETADDPFWSNSH